MHEELKKEFEEVSYFKKQPEDMDDWIYNQKLITIWDWIESKLPKEVEIEKPWDKISIKCPACRKVSLYTEDNFCPNCGAKINWR